MRFCTVCVCVCVCVCVVRRPDRQVVSGCKRLWLRCVSCVGCLLTLAREVWRSVARLMIITFYVQKFYGGSRLITLDMASLPAI